MNAIKKILSPKLSIKSISVINQHLDDARNKHIKYVIHITKKRQAVHKTSEKLGKPFSFVWEILTIKDLFQHLEVDNALIRLIETYNNFYQENACKAA